MVVCKDCRFFNRTIEHCRYEKIFDAGVNEITGIPQTRLMTVSQLVPDDRPMIEWSSPELFLNKNNNCKYFEERLEKKPNTSILHRFARFLKRII